MEMTWIRDDGIHRRVGRFRTRWGFRLAFKGKLQSFKDGPYGVSKLLTYTLNSGIGPLTE